jgi:hypothetical protein
MQPEEPSIEILEPKDATPSRTPTLTTTHASDTISEPIRNSYDSPCEFPFNFYDELFHDFGNAANQPFVGRHFPPKDQRDHPPDLKQSQWQEQYIGNLSAIMSREWLEEVESSAEVIYLPTRHRTINCAVIGTDGSIGYDPCLGINIISSSLVQTQLSEEPLSSSQKRLHVTPTQSLDCRGILRAAPVRIANPTLYLDFHVFDLPENLSHNTIIGRPIMKILEKVPRDQELELKVGKEYVPIQLSRAINTRVEPEADPIEQVMSASVQIQPARNLVTESFHRSTVSPLPPDPPTETSIMDAMENKWSTGVEHFLEVLWICSPFTILPCSIRGITIKAHLNPVMEVYIMPWNLAYTLLGNVTLRPSGKILKSCLPGHILECRGGCMCCASTSRQD